MKSRVSASTFALLGALAWLALPGRALAEASDWPREFKTPKGNTIVVYQPQAETFQGDRVTGRAAVSFTKQGATAPKFGVVFFSARVSVDRDAREVSVLDMKVSRVRFPGITPANEKKFTDNLEAEVPRWDLVFAYDRLLENVKVAAREKRSAEGLRNEPPKIVFADEPSVLLAYDGEPLFRDVDGAPVQVAVNTSLFVVNDTRSRTYYLSGGAKWWYAASNPLGPWRTVGGPPADIAEFAAKAQAEQKKDDANATADDGTAAASPPRIVVATEPTELVVTEGKPSLKPVAGTDGNLLAVDNTESDILVDVARQDYYVLLSGRWFRGKALASGGAWTYVPPDALPDSFAEIPPDSDSGDMRAAVAGTDEAEDAVLDAQIPQTTAVKRSEATLDVQWDGEPKFIPIEGSATSYAANASTSVLRIGDRFYACDNGVWFESDSPEGPWSVAESVPTEDIDGIPPSAPVYNVKYVRIYDVTPDVVYFGYTPGYTGVYPWHGTVVWGTGWHYRPWVGPAYWWPRPHTWGLAAHYNPWTGWGFGYSWSYPFFSVSLGWGSWFRPHGWGRPAYSGWSGWHRPGGGWFGPGGYRPPSVIVEPLLGNARRRGLEPPASRRSSGFHPSRGQAGTRRASRHRLPPGGARHPAARAREHLQPSPREGTRRGAPAVGIRTAAPGAGPIEQRLRGSEGRRVPPHEGRPVAAARGRPLEAERRPGPDGEAGNASGRDGAAVAGRDASGPEAGARARVLGAKARRRSHARAQRFGPASRGVPARAAGTPRSAGTAGGAVAFLRQERRGREEEALRQIFSSPAPGEPSGPESVSEG